MASFNQQHCLYLLYFGLVFQTFWIRQNILFWKTIATYMQHIFLLTFCEQKMQNKYGNIYRFIFGPHSFLGISQICIGYQPMQLSAIHQSEFPCHSNLCALICDILYCLRTNDISNRCERSTFWKFPLILLKLKLTHWSSSKLSTPQSCFLACSHTSQWTKWAVTILHHKLWLSLCRPLNLLKMSHLLRSRYFAHLCLGCQTLVCAFRFFSI